MHGMRLFHDGLRDAAMAPLATVLRHPHGTPSLRLAAAGLLAETYRGRADFLHAEHYYRTALAEADAIPAHERPVNEWYLHYRPRCALGLITVLRRLISSDHRTITTELRVTRDLAGHLAIADLAWQLSAVDGVYRRQCGDLDGAASLLGQAHHGMTDLRGFCFWYPEHVAALRLQVQLLTPSGHALVRRGARALLDDPSVRPWSRAVAAACYLHLQLDRMLERGASMAERIAAAADLSPDGAGHLLETLEIGARDERDPLIDSEWLILRLAWHQATGQTGSVGETARELLEIAAGGPPILGVLRACEARVIVAQRSPAIREDDAVTALAQHGSQALRELRAPIASYGYDADTVAAWACILDTPGPWPGVTGWLGGPLSPLRRLAWP
jgi:hypothetical protein